MKYRFKRPCPPHAKGDPVPASFGKGVLATMLSYGRIEPVPDTEPAAEKHIERAPADKMQRRGRTKGAL
jgi:hypothetical protein